VEVDRATTKCGCAGEADASLLLRAIATSLSFPLFALQRGVAQTDRGLDAAARAGSGRQEAG
jgi:hypothetical protein